MKMLSATRLGLLILSIGILLFAPTSGPSADTARPAKPVVVGMIPLLASPEKYDGKIIQTWGFLNLRPPEDNGIWLHKEDMDASLWKDSFRLQLTEKQDEQYKSLNHTYVIVQGTLHSKGPATPDLVSGTISDVTLVHGWKPYVPFSTTPK